MNPTYNYYKTLRDKGLINDQQFMNVSTTLYNTKPETFSVEDVDSLESIAKSIDVPFKRNLEDDENKLISAVNQFTSGVVEGFTTFGYADDPQTQTESILNRIGHLIGFAPDVIAGVLSFGATVPGSAARRIAGKGSLKAVNALRLNAAESLNEGLSTLATKKYLKPFSSKDPVSGQLKLKSVPMKAADMFIEQVQKSLGNSERLKNSWMMSKMSDDMLDTIKQGAHLGAAMAVSSRKSAVAGDWEAVREATIHGGYAGLVFGGISNYLRIGQLFLSKNPKIRLEGEKKLGDAVLKLMPDEAGITPGTADAIDFVSRGVAGSLATGVPMTAQGAPAADQIYEYLLGFFFGANGKPKHEQKVHQALMAEGNKVWQPVLESIKDGTYKNAPIGRVEKLDAWNTWGPKERSFAKQREQEYFTNWMTNEFKKDSDLAKSFFENMKDVLDKDTPKEVADSIYNKREFRDKIQKALIQAAEKMKDSNASFLQRERQRRRELPDVDLTKLETGQEVEVFTKLGAIEKVTVKRIDKDGVVVENTLGQEHVINKGQYISKNLYNPDFTIDKEVSERFGGKKVKDLSEQDIVELRKDLANTMKEVKDFSDFLIPTEFALSKESIRRKEVPSDSDIAAEVVREDPNQMALDFDRVVEKDSDSSPVNQFDSSKAIIEGIEKQTGRPWQTMERLAAVKKGAQVATRIEQFEPFVKSFYPELTQKDINKLWFENSGKTETKSISIDIEPTTQTVPYKYKGKTYNVEQETYSIKKYETPKFDANGTRQRLVQYETFANRVYGPGTEKMIQLINSEKSRTWTSNTDIFDTPLERTRQLMEVSAELQKDGDYVYMAHPTNGYIFTRKLIDAPFKQEFVNTVLKRRYNLDKFDVGNFDKTVTYYDKGANRSFVLNRFIDIDAKNSVETNIPQYESPYRKNKDLWYNEAFSNLVYGLQDAGYLPYNLSNVTLNQFKTAYYKHEGTRAKPGRPFFPDTTKRVQYYKTYHNGRTLDRELVDGYLKGRKLRAVVIEDFVDANGKMYSDGGMHIMPEFRKEVTRVKGIPESQNYLKFIIQKPAEFSKDRGMFIAKQAERHVTSKALEDYARTKNADLILYASAIKGDGRHQAGKIELQKGRYKEIIEPEIVELNPEHLRFINSEIEVPDRPVIQMHGGAALVRHPFVKESYLNAQKALIKGSIEGNNAVMARFNEKVKEQGNYEFNKIFGEEVKQHDIDLYTLVDIINNHSDTALGRHLLNNMYKEIQHDTVAGRINPGTETFMKNLDSINDILSEYNYDPLALTMHINKRYIEDTLVNHISGRMLKLRVPGGSSFPRLQSQDAALVKKLRAQGWNDNTFMLNEGHKAMSVVDPTTGKRSKLGDVWKAYEAARDAKQPKEVLQKFLDVFNSFAMNRSPVSDFSGVLGLEFVGFTGLPGKGVHVTPRNMQRLAGADTDGDAVAIYQGMSKDMIEAFRDPRFIKDIDIDLTDVKIHKNWGYERESDINQFIPYMKFGKTGSGVRNQEMQNSIAAGNVGKSDNFNHYMNDLFNMIEKRPDKRLPINEKEDVFIVPSSGTNRDTGEFFKSFEESYFYFNNFEAKRSLNLDLDGSKNSKNPDTSAKFDDIFQNHFSLVDAAGRDLLNVDKGNLSGGGNFWSYSSFNGRLRWYNLINGKQFKEGERFGSQSRLVELKNKITDEYMFLGDKFIFSLYTGSEKSNLRRLRELAVKSIDRELFGQMTDKDKRKILSAEYDLKRYPSFIYRRLPRDLSIYPNTKSIKATLLNVEPNKYTFDFEMPVMAKGEMSYKNVVLTLNQKDLNKFYSLEVHRDGASYLKHKTNFQNAIKDPKDNEGNIVRMGNLDELAQKFDFSFTGGNDFYLDIAKNFTEGASIDRGHKGDLSIDMRIIPKENYSLLFANLGKAQAKISEQAFYKFLEKNDMLNANIQLNRLIFQDISGKRNPKDIAVNELKKLWETRYSNEFYNAMEGGKEKPGPQFQEQALYETILNVASLSNIAVKYNELRTALSPLVDVKMLDNKIKQILSKAYEIRLNFNLASQNIREYDAEAAIKSFRENDLKRIGKVELEPEAQEMLSNVFSKTLLSNILGEANKIPDQKYFQSLRNDLQRNENLTEKINETLSKYETEFRKYQSEGVIKAFDYAKTQAELISKKINDNADALDVMSAINKVNYHTSFIGQFSPKLYRFESIPSAHRREFFKEVRDIVDQGQIVNSTKAEIELVKDYLPAASDLHSKPNPALEPKQIVSKKVSDKTPYKEVDVKGEEVSNKRGKDVNQMSILFETAELQNLERLVNKTEDAIEAHSILEKSIIANVNQMTDAKKFEFLEKSQPLVDIVDFKTSMRKPNEKLVVSEVEAQAILNFKEIARKNPRLLTDLEGDIADFFAGLGIEGKAGLGIEAKQMTARELLSFSEFAKDKYLRKETFTERFKKLGKYLGIKNANDPAQNDAVLYGKNPIKKRMHYMFYDSLGVHYLQPRELLSYEKDNIPVINRETGDIKLKRAITSTNTMELLKTVVDDSKRIAAVLQDWDSDRTTQLFDFENAGDKNLPKYKKELETIATSLAQAEHNNLNIKLDKFSRDLYDGAKQQALEDLARIKKEMGDTVVVKDKNNPKLLETITLDEYIVRLNQAKTKKLDWYADFLMKDVETIGTRSSIKKQIVDKYIKGTEFIVDGSIHAAIRDFIKETRTTGGTVNNLMGYNELHYILYELQVRQNVNTEFGIDIQSLISSKKPIPKEVIAAGYKYRNENPFQPINVTLNNNPAMVKTYGKTYGYHPQLGYNSLRGNRVNIENHIKYLLNEYTKEVNKVGFNKFGKQTKVEFLTTPKEDRNMDKFILKAISEYKKDLTSRMSLKDFEDTQSGEGLVTFISNISRGKSFPGVVMPSNFLSRSQHILPGYDKTNNALDVYHKKFMKTYTDTLASIRGSLYIQRFQRKNSLNDLDHTDKWTAFMQRSLQTQLGLDSFTDLTLDGIKKSELPLLKQYIDAGLNKDVLYAKIGRPGYTQREFLRKVDDLIRPNESFWMQYKDLGYKDNEGIAELNKRIEDYKMTEAKKLANAKNVDKIKRYGTLFHTFSDEAAVNGIRRIEERFGKMLGMKEGEFSFWNDLGTKKDPISGEMTMMSEPMRRAELAKKINAFSNFEGRYELLSLLFHPKTAIANFYGGGTNIYSDVGGDFLRKALSEKWLLDNVFKNVEYEVVDPVTKEVRKEKIRNMKDIQRFLIQKGLMEGIYTEEVGIGREFQKGESGIFWNAVRERMFKWERENPELSINPTEYEIQRKETIATLAKRYKVGESVAQYGAFFMRESEMRLRRTAAIAHYLNARQTVLPLIEKGELPFDSPYLIRMARKGIEASQYIYHSAYRSNYSNTSLGRVMTRFHPYAWNSVRRRMRLAKDASYSRFMKETAADKRFERQFTADLMSMALAQIFVGTMFEYALSPPYSWLQDTAQWLFGDEEDRKRAFFSSWPSTALAPLQIVTPPISRFVLSPVTALLNGEFDNFRKYTLATWAPGGRLLRDVYRSYQNPSMTVDWITGVPFHRIGYTVNKERKEVEDRIQEALIDDNTIIR